LRSATRPTALICSTSDSVAAAVGKRISAAIFALTAVTLLTFVLQTRGSHFHYDTDIALRLAPLIVPVTPAQQYAEELGEDLRDNPMITRWQPYIAEASERFGIPEDWIRAVIRVESGGRTVASGRPITSKAGAMGLMQLMKTTYHEMRVRYRLGKNVHDPRNNILAGAAYLHQLRRRYGYPYMFAAYNAGPTRVDEHFQTGKSLPRETQNYLGMVVQLINFTVAEAASDDADDANAPIKLRLAKNS
jgi:soluble lytic murein transglycosylase-like protein